MPESHPSAPRVPEDFAEILAGSERPLMVGEQAVNMWARLDGSRIPALRPSRKSFLACVESGSRSKP